jgi:hypothetical protein
MAELINQEHGSELTVTEHAGERTVTPDHIYLISHSLVFYYWPVWVFGFIMAGLTWFFGEPIQINSHFTRFYNNNLMHLAFVVIFVLVYLFTHVSMRGLASGMAILGAAFLALFLAWMDWWDDILFVLPEVRIYMNMSFYMFIASAFLIIWLLSFFVFDRMVYWRIEPGQITRERMIGGAEQSFPSPSVVFEELNQDLFRHYLLGFGTSDLKIHAGGKETYYVPNVLFAHRKIMQIQNLIKRRPS